MSTTFTNVITKPGSTQQIVNVSCEGKPFGMIWSWPNTQTELHPWHAKPLNGKHKTFASLVDAKHWITKEGIT